MPTMTVTCEDCGKRYDVAESAAGRRVKCKRCGHTFVVPGAEARTASPPLPVPDEADNDDDPWSRLAAVAAEASPAAAAGPRRPQRRGPAEVFERLYAALGPFGRWLRRRDVADQLFAVAGLLAAAFAVGTYVTFAAVWAATVALSAVAVACLLAGVVTHTRRALAADGAFRLPWGDILLIAAQIVLRVVVPVPIFVYRRNALRNVGEFYGGLAKVGLQVIGIAMLGGLLWLVPVATGRGHPFVVYLRWEHPGQRVDTVDPTGRPIRGNAAEITASNVQAIQQAIHKHFVKTHGLPATLADLDLAGVASPFDPSLGVNGYAYLPQNDVPAVDRAYLYDAVELQRTGSTHAAFNSHGDVRLVTRGELADWAVVPLPPVPTAAPAAASGRGGGAPLASPLDRGEPSLTAFTPPALASPEGDHDIWRAAPPGARDQPAPPPPPPPLGQSAGSGQAWDVVDARRAARATTAKLHRLSFELMRYRNQHGNRPPASLADLDRVQEGLNAAASPFDPRGAEPGYVYVAGNADGDPSAVLFYDAAELRRFGHTHVAYARSGRVEGMTRERLAASPGVVLP